MPLPSEETSALDSEPCRFIELWDECVLRLLFLSWCVNNEYRADLTRSALQGLDLSSEMQLHESVEIRCLLHSTRDMLHVSNGGIGMDARKRQELFQTTWISREFGSNLASQCSFRIGSQLLLPVMYSSSTTLRIQVRISQV
jgi:hypothetical protein